MFKEQNNKSKLNDVPLSDTEFEQVKNQIQFSSFYDVGKWLVGENGIVYVMGRKNWLFCGSEDGARSSCLLYSLIECAKMNKVNPEDCLCTIFELAADTSGWMDSNWSKLLPWNIKMKNN